MKCVLVALTIFGAVYAADTTTPTPTLYERLGGQPAIEAVASGLANKVLADSRINAYFVHAASSPENKDAYRQHLMEFICQATQGPCKYTGLDMVAVHKGRGITNEAFDAVVEDLVSVMDSLKVPAKEKSDVLALLAPMREVIVNK
ncbi:MAG: group 1 truncated hemoglobin [Acidobacteriota bacterium]|nr:group 1 truncated hemoglobin [Acidobacteriota bacterium]